MKFRDYVYIICMIFFIVLSYLLFDRGINVKTKIIVNHQAKSDLTYRVYLKENNEFQQNYLDMNERYIASVVDRINIDFNYSNLFSKDISGYYNYDVVGTLYAYLDNINDPVWTNQYSLLDTKTVVLNKNNIRNIDISDRVVANYANYRQDLANFAKKYNLELAGYFEVRVNIRENIQFKDIDDIVEDKNQILMRIPLTYDTFKISVVNDSNNIDSYYDFSTKEKINYILIIIGAVTLALAISFLALIIRNAVMAMDGRNRYAKELKRILNSHDDKIINVKRFYNKKKYNLIYVDSFDELLDVYNKVKCPINYREIHKGEEAMFVIMDDDSAWIYRLVNNIKK